MKNNKGQINQLIIFIGGLFTSTIIYFLVLEPLINPVIEIATNSIESAGLKIVIKLTPIGVVFGIILHLISHIRGGRGR